jgi:hypothetical protein
MNEKFLPLLDCERFFIVFVVEIRDFLVEAVEFNFFRSDGVLID